jgi:DNA polymerase/3'-5' exonuclease PolX
LFISHVFAHAAEMDGRTIADQMIVGGKTLVLNGFGYRRATFLGIKVYLAGLYLEEKSNNSDQIMNSNKIRKMRLLFVRGVGAEKIKSAWKESFDDNCGDNCKTFEPEITKLGSYIQDVKDGSVMDYTFFGDRIEIQADQKEKLEIKNSEFAKIMLGTWIGKKPVMEKLKTQLLGVKD